MSLLSKFKEYGVRKFSSALFKGPIKDAFSIYPIHDSVNWLPEFVNIKEPNLNILSENIILHFIKSFADVAYSYATQSKVTSQRQEMMILLIIRSDDTLKSSLYKLFIDFLMALPDKYNFMSDKSSNFYVSQNRFYDIMDKHLKDGIIIDEYQMFIDTLKKNAK